MISFRVLRRFFLVTRKRVLASCSERTLGFSGGGATPVKVLMLYFLMASATAERARSVWAEMALLEAPASDIPRI